MSLEKIARLSRRFQKLAEQETVSVTFLFDLEKKESEFAKQVQSIINEYLKNNNVSCELSVDIQCLDGKNLSFSVNCSDKKFKKYLETQILNIYKNITEKSLKERNQELIQSKILPVKSEDLKPSSFKILKPVKI